MDINYIAALVAVGAYVFGIVQLLNLLNPSGNWKYYVGLRDYLVVDLDCNHTTAQADCHGCY